MKVYIAVRYDLFPYFLLFKAEDTGEHYKVCDGLGYRYDGILRRLTKEQFDKLELEVNRIKIKERKMRDVINAEAAALLNVK